MLPTIRQFEYSGTSKELFPLALKTGALTLITLGIYRFWAKTKIREYIWSSTSLEGDRFEYHGTGLEKFLGFLFAIVILAIYIGLVQAILIFFGLNLFTQPETDVQAFLQIGAIYINVLALLPLIAFATYRARRYKMLRTSWRGIRCGMDNGAWGYVWRSILYTLLALVSLGILTPLMSFKLEKYMADRSYFGNTQVTQHGKWTDLYRYMKPLALFVVLFVIGIILPAPGFAKVLFIFIGLIGVYAAFIHFQVQSFGYLLRNKELGSDISFVSNPRTGTVIKTILLGALLIFLISTAISLLFGGLIWIFGPRFDLAAGGMVSGFGVLPLIFTVLGYFIVFLTIGALSLVWMIQPILDHYITSAQLNNIAALENVRQSEKSRVSDAEGFADALDVGGAI